MSKPCILVILGTGREGRYSEHVAKFLFTELQKQKEVDVEFADVRDFGLSFTTTEQESTKRWRDVAARADGFLVVSPEYNRGYPGELKMLLDQGEEEYDEKPVAICGVSSGGLGGARLVESLLPVFRTLGFIALPETLYISHVEKTFAGGELQDDAYLGKSERFLEALVQKTLKYRSLRG